MKKKNLVIGSAAVTAGLVAGSMFAPLGFAGAQETEPETDPGTDAPAAEAPETENDGRRGHRGNRGARSEAVAEAIGITTDELKAALQEGNTLAEIAAAQGVSEADLVSSLVASTSATLDEKVAAGDLTAEEAAEKKAGLEERITNAVNADPSDRQGHGHKGNRGAKLEALGETLGLTAEEIREGFQAGQSIADMATAQGVDVDSVVDQLVASAMERVDAALAEGKIDADRAAEITEGLEEKITEKVNAEPSERTGRRGHRGGPAADGDPTETGLDA